MGLELPISPGIAKGWVGRHPQLSEDQAPAGESHKAPVRIWQRAWGASHLLDTVVLRGLGSPSPFLVFIYDAASTGVQGAGI